MAEDSEYEILPHEELEMLRKEVAKIKKNPLGKKYDGDDLIQSIHDLTQTIESMNQIFQATNQEMLDDFSKGSLQNAFKSISSQNEEIAKGILSVAQLVQKQTELLEKNLNNKKPEETQEQKANPKEPPKKDMPDMSANTSQEQPSPQTPLPPNPSKPDSNISDLNMNDLDKEFGELGKDMPPTQEKKEGFFSKMMKK